MDTSFQSLLILLAAVWIVATVLRWKWELPGRSVAGWY
jgi:hypothetical protein